MIAEEDVAQDYEALVQFLYMAPVGLVQIARDGAVLMINPLSAQLLMPLAPDGALDNLYATLGGVAPDLAHRAAAFKARSGMVCDGLRLRVDAVDGGRRAARILSLTLLKLDDERLMAVVSDITVQVQRERLLEQNEAWFNAILTGITDYALASLDGRGVIEGWNESIGRVTGFDAARSVGLPYSIFYPPDATTPERVLDRLREADANGWSLDDGWRLRADGTRFWGSAVIVPQRERSAPPGPVPEAQRRYCLVLRDITDRRQSSEEQRRATQCDHLTGIANRRAFFEAAEREVERWKLVPRPLALVLFDADHFKRINDTHGHPVGDAVLRHLAGMLGRSFREVDVVARVGGEEFAVLLPSTDLATAAAAADRVRAAVAAVTVDADGTALRCTVSGGVAVMEAGVGGLDGLMKRADQALYAAKAAGRDRVHCWGAAAA